MAEEYFKVSLQELRVDFPHTGEHIRIVFSGNEKNKQIKIKM